MAASVEHSELAERSPMGARDSRPDKAPGAFRTIREVAEELGVPQHVLRFWESRFGQVRPLKRAGGRRYYRPEDVDLLKRIQGLLYQDGYTIRGVQKLFRDGGVKAVRNAAATGVALAATSGAGVERPGDAAMGIFSRSEGPIEAPADKAKPAAVTPESEGAARALASLDVRAFDVPRDLTLDETTRARLEALIQELEDLVGLLRGSTAG